MNKMKLEDAAKSIFLQCLDDLDILEAIKNKLNGTKEACVYEENQIQQSDDCLNEKIDKILKMMEDFVKSGTNKKTDREEELQEQNRNLTTENERLKNENRKLLTENKSIEEKCRIEISKYSVFEESLEIWNCINSLNYDNRDYLERLCGGSDVLAILSLGRDDGRIEQLWSYLRDMAIKGDVEKTELLNLNKYFEFCLKVANSTKLENEKYVILDIEPESEFDMNTCIRTSDSKQIGKIREIVVKSVKKGKNIKYKAIVRVE